ncbi:MAG: AAA family ATPase [Selenomonadaceae bacterium]|nr:AAA family ATPase [Selenomonadaceae bacterium]
MAEGRSSIIISIFSTGSGIGKTITAINLAAGLAKEGYAICLVDLDLQFGDIVKYLKLEPKYTIADANADFKNDAEHFNVKDYLTDYHYKGKGGEIRFSVLAPPRMIYDAYRIDVDVVENLIMQLNYFDFIVLDLSAVFSTLNVAMLDMSTVINFLGVIDFLPSVKNFKIGYDTLVRFEYEGSKIRLVENRANSQKLIDGRDVERLLGETFFHRLPNDFPSVNKSILEGCPLMFVAPDAPLTKSFMELSGEYTARPNSNQLNPATPAEPQGFFTKFFDIFGN